MSFAKLYEFCQHQDNLPIHRNAIKTKVCELINKRTDGKMDGHVLFFKIITLLASFPVALWIGDKAYEQKNDHYVVLLLLFALALPSIVLVALFSPAK